jgi:hypothetical protein
VRSLHGAIGSFDAGAEGAGLDKGCRPSVGAWHRVEMEHSPRRPHPDDILITAAQRRFASWMTDVLVYVVVLNLFVEFADAVIIDSFTISILTAVLLKGLLDVIIGLEHRVAGFFRARSGVIYRVVRPVTTFAILFLSKFVILEAVDLVFGDHVDLGHLLDVILLVIALMAARMGVGAIYGALGRVTGDGSEGV